ncbi:MAG: HAMP domain-containing sensor histidine kinase [Rhodospirillaceae bacterium]|nr:HAMP domain-containing sensor histidine kinase [Rhodospirillaceae bacterium]
MARFKRLVGSVSFRLALVYTLIFAVSVSGLFYLVFYQTSGFAERQVETAIRAEVAGLQDSYQRGGMSGLVIAINRRSDPSRRGQGIYLLIDQIGTPVAGNLESWPSNVAVEDEWISFPIRDLTVGTGEIADVRALQFQTGEGFRLLVGRDIRDAQQFRRQLLEAFNLGLALTIALGLAGGFIFGRATMRRIEAITRTCRSIMGGDLSRRVPVPREGDEIGQLSLGINTMLDQIERLMKGMQQVSDNVAHDLRTPLNRLRGRLEGALRQVNDPAAREAIEAALTEADGLLATFAALLRIARAEAGLQRNFTDLDLAAIGDDVAEMYEPLAEDKGIAFSADFQRGVGARGDRNLVAQALANVVDNAIKYTPAGGAVGMALRLIDGKPTFVVSDSGPGVPPEFRDKVFERLFRMEQSRTSPGSGLGLSLVQAVARSHALAITLDDNRPGLRVSIAFPQAVPVPVSSPPPRENAPDEAAEAATVPVAAGAQAA